MTEEGLVQIMVNGRPAGIAGLQTAIREIRSACAEKKDHDIAAELLKRLEEKNYIPGSAREAYGKAFVREFRKSLGQPFEADTPSGLHVKVLGPGCYNCAKLEGDLREVMAELGLAGDLSHVTDSREIGRYGVLGVPALVINDRVVCVGQTPHRNKIKEWLQAAASSDGSIHEDKPSVKS
jgi:hypothetical protein